MRLSNNAFFAEDRPDRFFCWSCSRPYWVQMQFAKTGFKKQRISREMQVTIRTKHNGSIMIYHVEIAGKGGITQYTFNLMTHLKKQKPHVSLVLLGAKEYELENLERNFSLQYMFNRFKTNPLKLFRFLAGRIKHEDIVHFQLSSFPVFVLIMMLWLKVTSRPFIVVTVHNVVSHETSWADKNILRTIYRLADRLIVHARQNRDELVSRFNIAQTKIWIIPHGNYLFAHEWSHTKTEPAKKKERFELLFFGYIRPYKGLDVLLRALARVVSKNSHVLLHIVGKAHENFETYARLIEKLKLKDYVHLQLRYVPIEEVQTYFKRADVVVLPYRSISQSGVVFLAYAFAKPVIATNIGGLPEVIENGKSGILVAPEDDRALAEAILNLMEDPLALQKMGAYALELSQKKYSWQAIARQTWQLYDSLNKAKA